MKLPILYKKTSTGAIQTWLIESFPAVEADIKSLPMTERIMKQVGVIRTIHGQLDGKLQVTEDVIRTGKNEGKKNATTAVQQADLEAQAKWTKQLKKRYVKTLEEAEAGEVDAVIVGGIDCMLAFTFEKQGHKIKYPCYGQPKLDGTRCIAIVEDGVATLYSRTRKVTTSLPHINAALEAAFPEGLHVFDGEAYAQHLNNDFETLIHLVRQVTPTEGHEAIQYWVYDYVQEGVPFKDRYESLTSILPDEYPFVLVKSVELASEDAVTDYFAECMTGGFEGAMLRNSAGLYVGKRSSDLIKVKEMLDDEFEIVGVEAGRGKMSDKAIFVCKTEKGLFFKAKMKGSLESLKQYVTDPSLAIGKLLTVQYQGRTADGSLRFPIGLRIRTDL